MKSIYRTLFAALTLAVCASASAVTFVPPNDPVGQVWTTNSNDGWNSGRGITFDVSSATSLTSVGVYQDLTNVNLTWSLSDFNTSTVFASGGGVASTQGLEWIDFATSVNLSFGTLYHLQFFFSGNSAQNFFYNNANLAWSQGGFNMLEGTQANNAGNFVSTGLVGLLGSIPPGGYYLIGMVFGGVNGTVGNAAFGRPSGPQNGARLITMGLRLEF